jgi:transposase
VGLDIGKEFIFAVLRWGVGDIERPWKIRNPSELLFFVQMLVRLGQGRRLEIGMEPTGTYGDALRQALADAGLTVRRVSTKASHDYAEVYDGVPSQHDGKDAAVVAELVALGKSRVWPWPAVQDWQEEMDYWVRRLEVDWRTLQLWVSRLEGLVVRHWPELAGVLKLTSGTLLRMLAHYGEPAKLAADPAAVENLWRWSFGRLARERIAELVAQAKTSVGVRMQLWSRRELRGYARQALKAKRRARKARQALTRLAQGHKTIKAQAEIVGPVTACVLWVNLGDPDHYDNAGAYRKAMGLNLAERSSGRYVGQLKISKRGQPAPRRWLYFAALRLSQREPVLSWFRAKRREERGAGTRAAVAVMRKLALALHQVGVHGGPFDVRRLFAPQAKPNKPGRRRRRRRAGRTPRGDSGPPMSKAKCQ